MKSGNLQPMSVEDRTFLRTKTDLSEPGSWLRLAVPLFFTLVGAALFSGLALTGLGLVAHLAGFPISSGAWRESPVTYYGAFATVALVTALVAVSFARWAIRSRRTAIERRKAVVTDLQSGLVKVDRLAVQGIKLLREPEHQSFIFLLKLSNGKILTLYDDQDPDGPDLSAGGRPVSEIRENLSLRTFPISQMKRLDFEGDVVALPSAIELVIDPAKWPQDESWCRVPWENIERHFGAKDSR